MKTQSKKLNISHTVVRTPQESIEQLKNKHLIVTCSELDMPELNIRSEAGGMALATRQLVEALCRYLSMSVRLIVPGVSGIPVDTTWRGLLPEDDLITLQLENDVLLFQIFQKKIVSLGEHAEVLALIEVDGKGVPHRIDDKTTFFRQFPDFNFRSASSREVAATLYGTQPDAQLLKPAALALWNDILAKAVDKLRLADGIMFSNYADNRLPDLLLHHSSHPERYAHLTFLHMIHAELGGSKEGLAIDNRITDNLKYPKRSPFEWFVSAIELSHVTLINPLYAAFLSERYKRFYGEDNRASPLLDKIIPKSITKPLHLGITGFNITATDALETITAPKQQFQPLITNVPRTSKQITLNFARQVARFKHTNQLHLYKMLQTISTDPTWRTEGREVVGRLIANPRSKIFTFFDRIDATKGAQWLLDVIPTILDQHSNAQFIIMSGFTKADQLKDTLFYDQAVETAKKYDGRFIFVMGQLDRQLLHAGSTFSLKPSLQETFGLGPLEAMSMGAIPIYYNDHAYPTIMNDQNAIAIEHLSVTDADAHATYTQAKLHPARNPVEYPTNIDHINNSLILAIQIALKLNEVELLEKATNGIVYVQSEHTWQHIIHDRFAPLIQLAFDRATME